MDSRDIIRTNGGWPDLRDLTGAEVVSVDLHPTDSTLSLAFDTGAALVVPPPWQYSSCLLAASSAEFDQGNEKRETLSSLIGLCGATLTAVEVDNHHLDLILGSIRISITAPNEYE